MKEVSLRNNCFDVIRLFACLQVLLRHAAQHFGLLPESNVWIRIIDLFPGVVLLFCLSGFLVASSLDRNSDIKLYLKKRALRIYPRLWLVTAITFILIHLTISWNDLSDQLIWLFGQMTAGQFYTPASLQGWGIGVPNGSLWTISVEVQFYLLLPLLLRLIRRNKTWKNLLFLFGLIAYSAVISVVKESFPLILNKLQLQIIFSTLYLFLIGVLSYHYCDIVIPIYVKTFWLNLFLLIFVNFFLGVSLPGMYINVVSGCLLCFLTLGAGYKFKSVRLKHDLTYGMYLIHMPLVNSLLELNLFSDWIHFVIAVAGSFLFAVVMEKIIELLIKKKLMK